MKARFDTKTNSYFTSQAVLIKTPQDILCLCYDSRRWRLILPNCSLLRVAPCSPSPSSIHPPPPPPHCSPVKVYLCLGTYVSHDQDLSLPAKALYWVQIV